MQEQQPTAKSRHPEDDDQGICFYMFLAFVKPAVPNKPYKYAVSLLLWMPNSWFSNEEAKCHTLYVFISGALFKLICSHGMRNFFQTDLGT